MELFQGSEMTNSSEELPDGDASPERLVRDLAKLYDVCFVLGITKKKKMDEFGTESEVTEERVKEALRFLTVTRDSNFMKLKEISEKMTEAWESYDTNIAKVARFSWIFLIQEAENAEQIIHWNVLSTESVKIAEKEVCELISAREAKIRKKYNLKKAKLKKMLAETHLTASDVQFDINETVTTDKHSYRVQKNRLKDAIRDLKEVSGKRKELVVRMEWAKNEVHSNRLSSEDQQVIISYAVNAARRMKSKEPIPYDGHTVEEIIEGLRDEMLRAANTEVVEHEELPRTRSGRR